MCHGPLLGKLFIFALPLMGSGILELMFNAADIIVVGRFTGAEALAAVGATSTLITSLVNIFMGVAVGVNVLAAQYDGAGDRKNVEETVHTSILLGFFCGFCILVVGILFAENFLKMMSTPDDILGQAVLYMRIYFLGMPAFMVYNFGAALLRATGDTKRPLYFLILAAFLNVVLDLWFIAGFHMGAEGAAWATVISQGVSGVLCLYYIYKKVPELHLHREDFQLDVSMMKWQMAIGFPMAFQYSITAIGTIVLQACLNTLGSVAAAGFAAACKIEQVVSQAYVALGTTMATYCAQNMGAGKKERLRQGFRSATWIGILYAVLSGLLIITVGKYLTVLFVSENLNAITGYVDTYLKCVGISFIPLVFVNVYRNGIQGMGFGLLPMTAGVAELIGRSVMAVAAAWLGSYVGMCFAAPMAWVLAGGLLVAMYLM